jgi:hypothetical protein
MLVRASRAWRAHYGVKFSTKEMAQGRRGR